MKNRKCKKNLFYRIWHWYIKGEYHCDKCPYSWEERTSYEYDEWDGGCYIKGDIYDTCRLFPPLRWIVGTLRKKKADYYRNHQYDDMGEWYKAEHEKEEKMEELLNEFIGDFEICWKDDKGEYHPISKEFHIRGGVWRIVTKFEDFLEAQESKRHPPENPWKTAIKWTCRKVAGFFKPYFCK